jgi:hypothetical protein
MTGSPKVRSALWADGLFARPKGGNKRSRKREGEKKEEKKKKKKKEKAQAHHITPRD